MAVTVCQAPGADLQQYQYSEHIMGVKFTIQMYAESHELANDAAEKAFSRIRSLDQALSDYKSGSEVNQLCRSAPHAKPQSVSPELAEVLQQSIDIHRKSHGAFDVTIGPASRLWRVAIKRGRLPTPDKIAVAKSRMGMDCISLGGQEGQRLLQISKADMQLDFGGIAKGVAADVAIETLRELGIVSALIDASGDIVVSDPPPGKKGWKVQVPSAKDGTQVLWFSNSAIATSGDVYQFLEVDGVRYSHIVDPKTATAIQQPRIVTVIHESGALADAYASVISVMGAEGVDLAESLGFQAQLIVARNRTLTDLEVKRTSSFPSCPTANSSEDDSMVDQ